MAFERILEKVKEVTGEADKNDITELDVALVGGQCLVLLAQLLDSSSVNYVDEVRQAPLSTGQVNLNLNKMTCDLFDPIS